MTVASSSKITPTSASASASTSWAPRHDSIHRSLAEPAVQAALTDITRAPHVRRALSDKAKGKARAHTSDDDEVDTLLDLALETFWSNSRLGHRDLNNTRLRALSHLQQLSQNALATSDFPSVTSLQRSNAAYVEIVRSRFNRQLYVLKTVVKGVARRESSRCNPDMEAQLLAAGQQEAQCRRPVPDFVASFQSQNSLHIVMQYFPAGDLDQLLHSAGQAGLIHGFGKDGGLLSESYVQIYATDIVAAVSWCHEQGFAHRDVKPANFLLDRSGHLKLCDFATAAPFAQYGNRRRVHYSHSCLAGTPDYIAPDILIGEEERLNALTGSRGASSRWGLSFADESSFSSVMPRAAPDSEGFYGPEVDWWSVGCVIYEMVFKNVPFWAETIREAHHRICNHEHYLKLDEQVAVSSTLKDLIAKLLTHRETRLGSQSSLEVQRHSFFWGVDWLRYLDVPAPFVPNLDSNTAKAGMAAATIAEEPSVLHSPSVMTGRPQAQAAFVDESLSMEPESIHLSQMFDGNVDEFPMFADSPEEAEIALARRAAMVDVSLPTRPLSDPGSPQDSKLAAAKWSDVDPTWVGFSRLPQRDAFAAAEQQAKAAFQAAPVAATPSAAPRPSALASIWETSPGCESMAASPEVWTRTAASLESKPITSTPYTRCVSDPVKQSPPPMISSTPFGGVGAADQRATRQRELSRAMATPGDGRYVTPLRKTSMPNLSSAYSGSVAPPSAIPASPYPFPLAATPAPATAARRLVSSSMRNPSLLRSAVQQRRSESPYSRVASMGSDSRCSGGSNAKRNFSENEAMEQLEAAVLQSARKVRLESQERSFPRRLAVLEEKVGAGARQQQRQQQQLAGKQGAARMRPQLTHSTTDSALLTVQGAKATTGTGSSPGRRPNLQELRRGSAPSVVVEPASPAPALVHTSAPQSLAPAERNVEAKIGRSVVDGRPPQLAMPDPIVTRPSLRTPAEDFDSEPDSPLSSRPGSSAAAGWNASHRASAADLPGWSNEPLAPAAEAPDPSRLRAPLLRNRRSDRQLKMEAQERTTPTRPTTRVGSPFLSAEIDFAHLSLGPPTPLEEHDVDPIAIAMAAAAAAAAASSTLAPVDVRQDDCRTPELVSDHSQNESEESGASTSGAESLRTLSASSHHSQHSPFAFGNVKSKPDAAPLQTITSLAVVPGKDALPRLSVPATLEMRPASSLAASRLKSRSHSQLPKLHHLSLGFNREVAASSSSTVKLDSAVTAAAPGGAAGGSAPRSMRRKDSREQLKEYRNSGRLQSPCLPSFPEDDDAFGGGPALVTASTSPPLSGGLASAMAQSGSGGLGGASSATWSRKGTMTLSSRRSSANLSKQHRLSSSSETAVALGGGRRSSSGGSSAKVVGQTSASSSTRRCATAPSSEAAPAPPAAFKTTKKSTSAAAAASSPSSQLASAETTAASPLTKMDNRLAGIQSSVFGLQNRITKLKDRLHN